MSRTRTEPPANGNRLKVAGLFAGIGGLELGLSRAGHLALQFCELDPGANAVLRSRFPDVALHDDVTTLRCLPKDVDLVAAGFPCQDLSQAGATKGLGGEQSILVDHAFRLLSAGDIPWVLLENVPFMLQLGRGSAIRHVTSELERLGYEWAYRVIDTRAFGLPQRRERVFILASRTESPAWRLLGTDSTPDVREMTDGVACGFYWTEGVRGLGWAVDGVPTLKGGSTIGIPSPPAIWMPDGSLVTPHIRDAERLQGFEADWTLPAVDVVRPSHRWKLVGNAVSVPVAEWIGSRMAEVANPDWEPMNAQPFNPDGAWPRVAFSRRGDVWTLTQSTWPVAIPAQPLVDFLKHPTKPLSHRALKGFQTRLGRGTLRRPAAFDRDLERLVAATEAALPPMASARSVVGRIGSVRSG